MKCPDIFIFIRGGCVPAFQNASGRSGAFCKAVKCPECPAEEETGDYLTVPGRGAGKSTALLYMSVV